MRASAMHASYVKELMPMKYDSIAKIICVSPFTGNTSRHVTNKASTYIWVSIFYYSSVFVNSAIGGNDTNNIFDIIYSAGYNFFITTDRNIEYISTAVETLSR